jgi:colanic acid/amylovoran biosynthesis glycosyltransferase
MTAMSTDIRLAIANPLREAYSETFIAQQISEFRPVVRIHGYPHPNETIPGGHLGRRQVRPRISHYLLHLRAKLQKSVTSVDVELAHRLRSRSVDVVLANFGYMAADLLPACLTASIPLVAHFHGLDAHRHDVCSNYSSKYQALASKCERVIAVSEEMKAALNTLGFDSEKITVIRYGVDRSVFGMVRDPSREPRFLAVGRFVDKKAPYLTLCAFREVSLQYPSAKLIFIGEGELIEATANLASYFGLSNNVEFRGMQPPDKVAAELSRATAFVQHSLSPLMGPAKGDKEGTPVSILEAMISGCPVVSVRHAGIGEVIESGREGLLVEERDVRGMATAMLSLIKDPALAAELSDRATRKALAEYTSSAYIKALQSVLFSVVSKSRKANYVN